ncbi:MAG: ATP-grasp domain-containing protein, partial [Bacteroidia bacterium]
MIEIGNDKIEDLFELSSGLCVATKREFVSLYDFDFRNYFQVKTILGETNACLILRIGAIADYEKVYSYFAELGLQLINSIEEHEKVSLLPKWYPEIQAYTPKSVVYETIPRAEEVEAQFKYPVFLKGERQTNRHKKELCIAENRTDLERIFTVWKTDPILNWQRMIVREFVSLM